MSLNGLDSPEVKEAHDAAVAEPGGWFILKYSDRDTVELLGRGNGGIVEIRNAISQYEESSPLYGFLRYRRRNVIIKYLPEDCSRLVQARVTVHFDHVCERFSPHDTVFPIAAAKELKDTKLSAACSLHTASGSTSSSTSSLRRRRLMEIAEEEEEQRASKRQSVVDEESARSDTQDQPPLALDSGLASSPEQSRFSGAAEPPEFVGAADPRPSSPTKSLGPELYTLNSASSIHYKPKVKLGPRPSLDGRQRPGPTSTFRPISALPAGFKAAKNKKDKGGASDKEDMDNSASGFHEFAPNDLDAGAMPARPHTSGGQPPPTPASQVYVKQPLTPGPGGRPPMPTMSPEKTRLKKAMQLREKKKQQALLAAAGSAAAVTSPEVVAVADPNGEPSPTLQLDKEADEDSAAIGSPTSEHPTESPNVDVAAPEPNPSSPPMADTPVSEPAVVGSSIPEGAVELIASEHNASGAVEASLNNEVAVDSNLSPTSKQGDSVEDTEASLGQDHASLGDSSRPTSPMVASSELGLSTKASSLSESTDETILNVEDTEKPTDKVEDIDAGKAVDSGHENSNAGMREVVAELTARHKEISSAPAETPANRDVATHGDIVDAAATMGNVEDHIPRERSPSASLHAQTSPTTSNEQTKRPSLEPPAVILSVVDIEPTPITNGQAEQQADDDTATTYEAQSQGTSSLETTRSKRIAALEPIKTEPSGISDDESLMEELHSATLQQARPVTVSKSPITPIFPTHATSASPLSTPTNLVPMIATTSPGPSPEAPPPSSARSALRASSNPTVRAPLSVLTSGDSQHASTRAASSGAAFLNRIAQQTVSRPSSPGAASISSIGKKPGVGSSISQRIKALEQLSSTGGGPAPAPTERPQSMFFAVRHQPSVRDPAKSPSVVERANSMTLGKDNTPSPPRSRGRDAVPSAASVLRDRSGSISSRLSVFEGGNLPRGRPDSVQVTARIVRDPRQAFPRMPEYRPGTSDSSFDLRQSVLVVDHKKGNQGDQGSQPKETLLQRRMSNRRRSVSTDGSDRETVEEEAKPTLARRRSSLSVVKDFIKDSLLSIKSPSTDNLHAGLAPSPMMSPNTAKSPSRPPSTHRNSMLSGRLSVSSRRSSMSKDRDAAPSITSPSAVTSPSSGDESKTSSAGAAGSTSGKSRASRFIRRLSNSLSASRKNVTPVISPTVAEERDAEAKANQGQAASLANLGDVNVQFPDNLLWKRRTLCLDSQGFIVLSAVRGVAAANSAAVGVKRYHLSDFHLPYAPEMELQELPNSVCLEFIEGSSLQIACEDRVGQSNTLRTLQEAHHRHSAAFGH